MKNSHSARGRSNPSLFENLENRLLFSFGDADTNFGVAGRAVVGFSNNGVPAITQVQLTSGSKILAGGTAGLARFTSTGTLDSSFGSSGKVTLAAGTTFIADATDPTNNNIYVLLSAASGTGLLRYSANGKLDSTFGSGGTVTVTTSRTFTPQAMAVQSDGKIVIAGVFKTDSNNGRKVRVYRLKTDGTSDTSFNSTGATELNLGQTSFLANTAYDRVAAVKVVGGGKIDVIGGSVEYTPASTDPETGDFIDASYNKAIFAVARLKTDGSLDGTYVSGGIARADYATGDQVQVNANGQGLEFMLPHAATTRADDSVLVGGLATRAVVTEFAADGSVKYTTSESTPDANALFAPAGINALSDGRSVLLATPVNSANHGYAMVAIGSDGTLGNVVFSSDNDGGTTDVEDFSFEGAITTNSNGELLIGGGNNFGDYVLQENKPGSASDKRPDEFLNARANDIAIDNTGGLHVAYYDAATTHLMYAHRNPDGLWDAPILLDKNANAGQYVSIDFNSKNNPGIAYFDGTNGDLKLAQFDGSKWHLESVDSKGSVGLYPSFDYDNADEPVITYFNKTKGKLTFALKKANTTWGYENVDSSGDNVGRSSSLVASPNTGRYTVAYVDSTTGSVMWAGHEKGGKWTVKLAAKTKGSADFLSMTYGNLYQPMISYYDAFSADLKITSFFNNQFNIKTLATAGAQGLYSQAFFSGNFFGSGQVFAYNRSQDKITEFDGAENTTPTATDIVTGGGRYLSMASSGSESVMAYYDANAGVIKVRPGPTLD